MRETSDRSALARALLVMDALDAPTVPERVARLQEEIRVALLVAALKPFMLSAGDERLARAEAAERILMPAQRLGELVPEVTTVPRGVLYVNGEMRALIHTARAAWDPTTWGRAPRQH